MKQFSSSLNTSWLSCYLIRLIIYCSGPWNEGKRWKHLHLLVYYKGYELETAGQKRYTGQGMGSGRRASVLFWGGRRASVLFLGRGASVLFPGGGASVLFRGRLQSSTCMRSASPKLIKSRCSSLIEPSLHPFPSQRLVGGTESSSPLIICLSGDQPHPESM